MGNRERQQIGRAGVVFTLVDCPFYFSFDMESSGQVASARASIPTVLRRTSVDLRFLVFLFFKSDAEKCIWVRRKVGS